MHASQIYQHIAIAFLYSGLSITPSFGQNACIDTVITIKKHRAVKTIYGDEQHYRLDSNNVLVYKKPKHFSFITNLPKDAREIAKVPFKKENLTYTGLIAAATGALLLVDQPVIDGVRKFSDNIHLSGEGGYTDLVKIRMGNTDIKIIRAPKNINTAIYQFGQGFPSLLLGGGLYVYGKIKKDYRSLSTASQLAESFILMGIETQLIKRISGRQSPFVSTVPGGRWRPLPSFSKYQHSTPEYDAFPSGHLATVMSTVTILAENYPEKKYIKPVGYTIIGLVGYSMLNNEVHWISDYPLALVLGYISARQVAKRNRQKLHTRLEPRRKATINYTLSNIQGIITPGIIINF